MLQIKTKQSEYPKDGRIVFVYVVGSNAATPEEQKAELDLYTAAQGNFLRKNAAGEPLFFSGDICPIGAPLVVRQSTGRYGVNQDLEAQVEQQKFFQTKRTGELVADAQFMGISRGAMKQMLLAKYAS